MQYLKLCILNATIVMKIIIWYWIFKVKTRFLYECDTLWDIRIDRLLIFNEPGWFLVGTYWIYLYKNNDYLVLHAFCETQVLLFYHAPPTLTYPPLALHHPPTTQLPSLNSHPYSPTPTSHLPAPHLPAPTRSPFTRLLYQSSAWLLWGTTCISEKANARNTGIKSANARVCKQSYILCSRGEYPTSTRLYCTCDMGLSI